MRALFLNAGAASTLACWLGLVLVSLGGPSAAQSQATVFEDSFESPLFKRMFILQGNQRVDRVQHTVRDGSHALRFRLDRLRDNVPYRCELSLTRFRYDAGRTFWYGISMFVPGTWTPDPAPTVVMQWFAPPDRNLGESFRAPPLNLDIVDERWILRVTWDEKRVTPSRGAIHRRYSGREHFDLGPLTQGRWVDWIFRIKWDHRADGDLTIWKDGAEVLRRKGGNTYNDASGPYLKFGLYVPLWNPDKPYFQAAARAQTRVILMDRLRILDERGSLEAMRK